jgi:hypothetical protein
MHAIIPLDTNNAPNLGTVKRRRSGVDLLVLELEGCRRAAWA